MVNSQPKPVLRKTIKLRQLFTLGAGTIIGVAWLMVLGTVLEEAGPLGAAVAFGMGASAMIPIALCYAEIAGMLPFAGGEVVYAYEIFGIKTAYVAGICLAFTYIINSIFFAVSVGWLVNKLLPGIQGAYLYSVLGQRIHLGDLVIGLGGMLFIAILNFRGTKSTTKLQDAATYGLIIATCIFVVAGIVGGDTRNFEPLVVKADWAWGWGGVLAVLAITPFFYAGFNLIPQALEEMSNEADKARLSGVLTICILATLIFYCLVITAVVMTLPRQELLSFDLPIPGAFAVAFGSKLLADVVLFAGLVGLIAAWNAIFFAAVRVLYALGRSQIIHPAFGRLHNAYRSPSFAVLIVALIGVVGIFLGRGALLPVVNVTSTLISLMYVIVTFGVLRARRLLPNSARPFRVPGGMMVIYIAAFTSIFLVSLSLYQQYQSSRIGLPVEWYLLGVLAIFGLGLWWYSRELRNRIFPEARRRLILAMD